MKSIYYITSEDQTNQIADSISVLWANLIIIVVQGYLQVSVMAPMKNCKLIYSLPQSSLLIIVISAVVTTETIGCVMGL